MRFGTRFLAMFLGLAGLLTALLSILSVNGFTDLPGVRISLFLFGPFGLALIVLSLWGLGLSWGRKVTTAFATFLLYTAASQLFCPAFSPMLIGYLAVSSMSLWLLIKMNPGLDPMKDQEKGLALWAPSVLTAATAGLLIFHAGLPFLLAPESWNEILKTWFGPLVLELSVILPASLWISWGWVRRTPRARVWAPILSIFYILYGSYWALQPKGAFPELEIWVTGAVAVLGAASLFFQIRGQLNPGKA